MDGAGIDESDVLILEDGSEHPTFEDLTIDDSLSDLDRIQKYAFSNIALQRLVHIKMIAETARREGYETTLSVLVPLLERMVTDDEAVVRQHLAEQIPGVSEVLIQNGGVQGYSELVEGILPVLSQLLHDPKAEVRHSSGDALVEVSRFIHRDDLGQHILTMVLELAHDVEEDELRMTAVGLMAQLAEMLGAELCHQFITPEVIALSEDPVFRVRKWTAMHMDRICAIVGPEETVDRLLPSFLQLCEDEIWGVRKACAESIVRISSAVSLEIRIEEILPAVLRLITDPSRWVRTAVFHKLGHFIATLPREHVNSELLDYYTGMAEGIDPETQQEWDVDVQYFCAFSLPAVLSVMGRESWDQLRTPYIKLVSAEKPRVRKTLACSLHEVARILGQELSQKDLMPVLDQFLNDEIEVQVGALKHVAEFLQELGPQQYEKYVGSLQSLVGAEDKAPPQWRSRQAIAGQLPSLLVLSTSIPSVVMQLLSLLFSLLRDDVSLVRDTAVQAVPILLYNSSLSAEKVGEVISQFQALARASTYKQRQIFIRICQALMEYCSKAEHKDCRNLFLADMFPECVRLASDSVKNVQLAVAKALFNAPDWVKQHEAMCDALSSLSTSVDAEVQRLVTELHSQLRETLKRPLLMLALQPSVVKASPSLPLYNEQAASALPP